MLEGGHAFDALPQLAATVNCRVLPEDSPEYVLSTLQKVVADEEVSLKQLSDFAKAVASPRLGVESFYEGQAFFYELVKGLSGAGK
jgi:hypothetical protein